jgi:hypothetical protein
LHTHLIGVPDEVAPGQYLGHPNFVDGGKAYVGGEIVFNESTKQWRINDQSGRYSRGKERTLEIRNQLLANVQQLFEAAGLEVGVRPAK